MATAFLHQTICPPARFRDNPGFSADIVSNLLDFTEFDTNFFVSAAAPANSWLNSPIGNQHRPR